MVVKDSHGEAIRGVSIVVLTGMKVVQDQDERYVSDVEAAERGARSCQSVRRQERMTVRLQPALAPSRQEDRRFPAPIGTGKELSSPAGAPASPLCAIERCGMPLMDARTFNPAVYQ